MSMTSVNDLVAAAMGDLQSGRSGRLAAFSSPNSPACVFYFGERSQSFHADVERGLRDAWGGASRHVCYAVVPDAVAFETAASDSDAVPFVDASSGKAFSINDLQRRVMDMMCAGGYFSDATHCEIYCVLDTTGLTGDAVRQWYMTLNGIKAVLAGVDINAMLIALLNESLGRSNAGEVKGTLRAIYEDSEIAGPNRHLYDCVFLYGNYTKSGWSKLLDGFDPQRHGERDIVPDVIALTNSVGEDRASIRRALYDNGGRPAITAAFKYVDKPCRDIVVISLRHIVEALSARMDESAGRALDDDAIDRALGIQGSRSAIVEGCMPLIDEVLARYQGFERHLPCLNSDVSVASLPFGQADQETGGCLRQFVDHNHLHDLMHGGAGSLEGLDHQIADHMVSALDAGQLLSLNEQTLARKIEHAFTDVIPSEESIASRKVADAVKLLLVGRVAQSVRDITLAVVRHLRVQAEQAVSAFNRITQDVAYISAERQQGVHIKVDSFYSKVVSSFFANPQLCVTLLRKLLSIGNDEQNMLDVLREEALLPLFESAYGGQCVFALGFMDELVLRLTDGHDPNAAVHLVGQELVDNVGDYIGFKTLETIPQRIMEAYLLYVDDDVTSAAGKLCQYLDRFDLKPGVSRVFHDASLQDSATSIWFYPLETRHL